MLITSVSGLIKFKHNAGHTAPREHKARWSFARILQENDRRWAAAWVERGCPSDDIWEPESGVYNDEDFKAKRELNLRLKARKDALSSPQTAGILRTLDEIQKEQDTYCWRNRTAINTDRLIAIVSSVMVGPTPCVRRRQIKELITNFYYLDKPQGELVTTWIETGRWPASV